MTGREHWQPRDEHEPEPRDRHYEQAREELSLDATEDEVTARAWELMDEEIADGWAAYRENSANNTDDEGL